MLESCLWIGYVPADTHDAARKEIVDGEKDAVVVADGEDENAYTNNLDDELEYINDNLTVVGHDSLKWCMCGVDVIHLPSGPDLRV